MSEQFEVHADACGKPTEDQCEHLEALDAPAEPHGDACEDCAREELASKNLRSCLTCGQVACDDESPGRHAQKHWQAEGHPLFRSLVPTDTWAWCYEDELLLESEARSS